MGFQINRLHKVIGPGIIVAATGVGAGDLIAAAVSGATYGYALLWAAILGALLKYVLNEGVSRYQLISGQSLLHGWQQRLHPFVSWYFIIYLFLWSFIVAGALMAACGLAAHAMIPELNVIEWGMIHSVLALVIVFVGKFKFVEKLMRFFIAMMFVVTILCAILLQPDIIKILKSMFIPTIPEHSVKFILGVIGGVGGSVTLLSYGYWIKEKKWSGKKFLKRSRTDLGIAYILTAIFGVSIMIIAAGVKPEIMNGSKMVVGLADKLETVLGEWGKWIFLLGFWGAVFSSMVGVWQGIPYLFADFNSQKKSANMIAIEKVENKSYNIFLLYLALPPMVLLFLSKPVWLIILYALSASFFMPFLAITLLFLNNKFKYLKKETNGKITNALLVLSLLVFVYLLIVKILEYA
jgi:Mn2+/Fe2+ NRAMP family transporter